MATAPPSFKPLKVIQARKWLQTSLVEPSYVPTMLRTVGAMEPPYVPAILPTVGDMDHSLADYSRNAFALRCVAGAKETSLLITYWSESTLS